MMPHDFSVLDFCKKCGATRTEASHDGKLTLCPGCPVSLEAGVRLGRGGPSPSQSAPHPLVAESSSSFNMLRLMDLEKEAATRVNLKTGNDFVIVEVQQTCTNCGIETGHTNYVGGKCPTCGAINKEFGKEPPVLSEHDWVITFDMPECRRCGVKKYNAIGDECRGYPITPSEVENVEKLNLKPILYPDGDFLFEVDKGKEVINGKTYWPAHVRLQLNARDAFSFAVSLLNKLNSQIENGSFNDVCVEMTFPGSIKRLEPE